MDQIKLSPEGQKAEKELKSNEDKKEINTLLKTIDTENEVKRREIETQKEMITRQINNCQNDDEKTRLMKQLD